MRPLIGISCCVKAFGVFAMPNHAVSYHYIKVVLGPVGRVEDALDLLRSGPPDAAVLDVNLFGATVDPVAFALERMGVPFLFCTGYQGGGTAGERHSQAPVLGKPVNANTLLAAVDTLISAR